MTVQVSSGKPVLLSMLMVGVLTGIAALVVALQPSRPIGSPIPGTQASPDAGVAHTGSPTVRVDTQRPLHIRVAQANLRMGLSRDKLLQDVDEVRAYAPDFVSYNEVGLRRTTVLQPKGYAVFRTPGRFTGEAAVAWRSARWTLLGRGTTMVSHRTGRLPWQRYPWGIRYASWVTVRARTGQRVSVVSVHTAPRTRITHDLLEPSIVRIGRLVRRLAARGPVIVAGDLNVPYSSARYPRSLLARFRLTSTYDLTGTALPTGNHHGATIDYVLISQAGRFAVTRQTVRHLNSDHNALVVDLVLDLREARRVGPPGG